MEDFRKALTAKGTSERHVRLVCSRVRTVLERSRFVFWSDIVPSKVEVCIADMRTERGISAQTANLYLAAFRQFARWLVRDGRAPESPIAHLQGGNVRTDRRHDRRALSIKETKELLRVTQDSGRHHGMSGPERALLYRLALETGLRVSELRSLTTSSLDLKPNPPTLTVGAACSKHRREDVLPLREDTASLLREHCRFKLLSASLFPPITRRTAQMLRKDLKAAGNPVC